MSVPTTGIPASGTRPPRNVCVTDLVDGQTIEEVFLLADKQLRANRNAELYLLTQLRDRTGVISGLMWNVREPTVAHFSPGDYVRARGKVQLFQGNLQLILTQLSPVDPSLVDPEEFTASVAVDSAALLERLSAHLRAIKQPDLRRLAELFLEDDGLMTALASVPAGIKAHHSHIGGLLQHVVTLLDLASGIAPHYEHLDRDLLVMGVFLHDLGKVRELTVDPTFAYTDEGQLLGHMTIAVEMLSEKLRAWEASTGLSFPTETTLRLKHMILSHHGSYEHGSSKLPMTLEAIALHHLDALDAKLNEFQQLIDGDPNTGSSWTPFQSRLERKLFKGATTVGN